MLLLSSVNAWLLTQKSLVSKKTRGVIAAVRDRNSLVLALKGLLESLGLKRRAKPLPSLQQYLTSKTNGAGYEMNEKNEMSPGAEVPTSQAGPSPKEARRREYPRRPP